MYNKGFIIHFRRIYFVLIKAQIPVKTIEIVLPKSGVKLKKVRDLVKLNNFC